MIQQHATILSQPSPCRLPRRAGQVTNLRRAAARAVTVVATVVVTVVVPGTVSGASSSAGPRTVSGAVLAPATPATAPGPVGTVVVNVVGVGAQSGTVIGLLFNRNDGFPAKIGKACQLATSKVAGNVVTLRFADVPLGTYAVTVYHDVNDNRKLDTNWIGIPKEPVAVSNNAKGRMGPPKWKDAAFELRAATKELTVSLVRI